MTEAIILVDGCKFSEKDGLDFIFIVEIGTAGSGMDEHETSPRGSGTYNTTDGGLTTRHDKEKRRESFLI